MDKLFLTESERKIRIKLGKMQKAKLILNSNFPKHLSKIISYCLHTFP